MIKRILALLLALVMLTACAVGCNKKNTIDEEVILTVDNFTGVPANAVAKTANFGLTANQLQYYFNYSLQNFIYAVESYGLSLSYFGLDTNKPLKEQECNPDPTAGTWFDYFMTETKASATNILVMCEAAHAAGYKLSDEDKRLIEDNIASFREGAEKEGKEFNAYIEEQFGFAMTEAAFINTMILTAYSGAYADYIESQADVSDDALEKAYEKNRLSFEPLVFLAYAVSAQSLGKDATIDDCKKIAETVAKAKDEKEFKSLVEESLEKDLGLTGDKLKEALATVEYKEAYDGSEFHDLLLKSEEGSSGVYVDEEAKGAIAYRFLKIEARDDSVSSRDVRHILFTNKTYKDDSKVKEVYDKWVKDGAKIEDFEALAKEYSEDPGSSDVGGLYEGVTEGQMVEEFNDWLFDEKREVGDHAIVESKSYGWHIMYYEGGMPTWKYEMIQFIKSEAFNTVRELAGKEYPVTYDDAAIAELDF